MPHDDCVVSQQPASGFAGTEEQQTGFIAAPGGQQFCSAGCGAEQQFFAFDMSILAILLVSAAGGQTVPGRQEHGFRRRPVNALVGHRDAVGQLTRI